MLAKPGPGLLHSSCISRTSTFRDARSPRSAHAWGGETSQGRGCYPRPWYVRQYTPDEIREGDREFTGYSPMKIGHFRLKLSDYQRTVYKGEIWDLTGSDCGGLVQLASLVSGGRESRGGLTS